MEKLEIRIPQPVQARLAYELGMQYPNPLHALREYLTNAVDAVDDSRKNGLDKGLVKTLIVPEDRRIVVQDNAFGMDKKILISLPSRIGDSAKLERIDQRGEKGVGLLAFASIGTRVHIISRKNGDNGFHYLRYEEKDGKLEAYGVGELTSSEMEQNFYGSFQHGTKIIVDCTPAILYKNLKEESVEQFIQGAYHPLLLRRDVNLQIEGSKRGYAIKINAPTIKGIELLNEELEFEARKSRETEHLKLFVNLVFNPEMEDGRVSVFSKDVRVYESVLQLEESLAKCDFWKCGQIAGFINEPNLKLTLGRHGIQRNSRAYEGLIEKLEEIHEKYWPQIRATIKEKKEDRGRKIVLDAWREFQKAYEVTEPLNKRTRPPNPNPKPGPGPKPNKPGKTKKRILHFGQPRFYEFGISERDLRSKLDDTMGEPVVAINIGHKDYKTFVLQEIDPKKAREYTYDISSHPIAEYEAREELKYGGTLGDQFDMAVKMERRAQDLKFSIIRRKRKKGKKED